MAANPQLRESPSDAWTLYDELPWTDENRRAIVLAFLEETGDLPLEIEHSFMMESRDLADSNAIGAMIDDLRAQHFAAQGKPVPRRSGPMLR